MAVKIKLGSSLSCVCNSLSSPLRSKSNVKVSTRLGLLNSQPLNTEQHGNVAGIKACRFRHGELTIKGTKSERLYILFATSEDQESYSDLEPDDFEQETQPAPAEDISSPSISYYEGAIGRPGFVSFYSRVHRREDDELLVPSPEKRQSSLLWFVGPTVLVASFVFPSLYLRRILSTIFEDSLLTDFLILFFTEALFYCGVSIFLLLIHHLRRRNEPVSPEPNKNLTLLMGYRISSVTVLVLSLIIPMVTMGFVWPWTGPAASATLAPYLVGIVVQFAFEQYATRVKSPSWPAIPIIFQVYRLHQLNRAAQLVTALSFTVRGAEMTSHNLAINGSLSTLLNVLQFLGVICIWSLSSFIMRYFPSSSMPE